MSIHKDAVPDVDCNHATGTFTKATLEQMNDCTTSTGDCAYHGPPDVADVMYLTFDKNQRTSDANNEGLRTFYARPAEP